MRIGVAGIGLIGGSMARAYKAAGHEVYIHDKDEDMIHFAVLAGAADGRLTEEVIPTCDLILLAIYPGASRAYLTEIAHLIPATTMVIDCCGTKRSICEAGFALAKQYGFTFVGGHPMAGTQYSGFRNSRSNMFNGASMVVVPPVYDDAVLLQKVKDLLAPCGFARLSVTTAEEHDHIIAFTSQLAHVLSNAYVKSPMSRKHHGFSAGSYRDLTRVAEVNAPMWTDLFLENQDYLVEELNILINNLAAARDALAAGNAEALQKLLQDGTDIKKEVDG